MAIFSYIARETNTSNEKRGLVEAATSAAAVVLLRNQGLMVVSLAEKHEEKFEIGGVIRHFLGASANEVFTFTREFSTMVSSGLPVTQALRILSAQATSKYFREVLEGVVRDVEGGMSLSKALEKYPEVFNALYLNLIRSGEISGTLDKVLERLSANLEKDREFRGKLKGALIYPAIVLCMMLGVIVIMLVFVVPKLTSMYESMGVELPLPTQIMVGASKFLVGFWWLVILAVGAAFFAFRMYKKTPMGKSQLDRLTFKLPVFGSLIKMSQLSEFTRDLGILVGSGIPIIEALKVSKDALSNEILRNTIDKAITQVGRGQSLSQIIAADHNFPMLISQMLQVGEETGKIDKVLLDVSHFFESETDFAVKGLSAALEPIIMVFLGGGVGVLILSIITPIYKLTSAF